ncbi:MAG: formylglycine-generating enzyme family protein [Acidobacteriia bacterium]|nr:formylglycine-generating enzyme family protein [Terriglobia bacterium]
MLRNCLVWFVSAAVLTASAAGQQSFAGLKAGDIRGNSKDGQEYAWISPGTFTTGCSQGDADCGRGDPQAQLTTIAKGFWMGQTEITVGAYKRFIAATGGSMPPESQWNPQWQDNQRPVVNVTWDEAGAFCKWAGGRLPLEAEWEYAARSGSKGQRYGELDAVAWYMENGGRKGALAVGQKAPNAWGLYDTLGNVWEWTTGVYPLTGQNDGPNLPTAPVGRFMAIRGGSWDDAARLVRISVRGRAETPHRSNSIGARCVLESL